jgi:hypothetical protein
VGHTSWGGKITIIPNLGDDAFNVVVHEGTHRFFSPVGTGLLATARQGLKALGHRSQLLTWAEEVIAHGVEFGNFSHGLEYMRYVGQSMYGISRTRLVLEGTLLTGGYLYGNYKLGTAYLNTNDK